MLILGERALRYALSQYLTHYHTERHHQGLSNLLAGILSMRLGNNGLLAWCASCSPHPSDGRLGQGQKVVDGRAQRRSTLLDDKIPRVACGPYQHLLVVRIP